MSLFRKKKPNEHEKISYAQCGEDLIVDFIFRARGIEKPTYMDIGAHHPWYINNTAIFYKRGCRGINIEPDPALFSEFEKDRPEDINLNIGIADKKGVLDFYINEIPTLNTFSKTEAERVEKENGYKTVEVKKIKVETINDVLASHFKNEFPDFLTLDVEGLDFEILKTIDFNKSRPLVICVETITFAENGKGQKKNTIIDFICKNGYMLFADTYINSIFVKQDFWKD